MKDILRRYYNMENRGAGIYFDADEIVELLDHFEKTDDIEQYKKVVKLGQKIHPHNKDIKTCICKFHLFNEEFEKALALIDQIHEPDNLVLNLIKYECLCALDRFNEVVAHLETQQNHQDEDLRDTYEFLAALLNEQYNGEYAYDLICRGLALFPDSTMLKEELGYYYESQGDLQPALSIVEDLIRLNPYNPDYWYLQGRIYTLMETYDKAIESFDLALIYDDSDWETHVMKAYCHYMIENYEKVVEVYVDVFAKKSDVLLECVRPWMEAGAYDDCAFCLLRYILGEFDVFQCFPQVIAESMKKLFYLDDKNTKRETPYLRAIEIKRKYLGDISSNDLSAMYLYNKNNHN